MAADRSGEVPKIDYRSGEPLTDARYRNRWWAAEKPTDLADAIAANVAHLKNNDSDNSPRYQKAARMYGDLAAPQWEQARFDAAVAAAKMGQGANKVVHNVIAACVDALHARITRSKPLPMFLPSGGNYRIQRKAKKLNKFVEGLFYELGAQKLMATAFKDACVFGLGSLKVFATPDRRLAYERTHAVDLLWDSMEAAVCGSPRSLYQKAQVDRQMLVSLYPDMDVDNVTAPEAGKSATTISDTIVVYEAWHLPSGPGKGDGRHVWATGNQVLFDEPYKHADFPFVWIRYQPSLFGFSGRGIADILYNRQLEINQYLMAISRAIFSVGGPKLAVEQNSNVNKAKLTNVKEASIIEYRGQAPQWLQGPIVAPEVYQHLQTLIQGAFEELGISQLSAQSQKPAGLDSGKALREFDDIESDRFNALGQAYENCALDLARLSIRVMKDVVKGASYTVRAPAKSFTETIDWKDVQLRDEEYTLQLWPVNLLSRSPASRLQDVQDLASSGMITQRQAKRLLDLPDLQALSDLSTAAEDYAQKVLDGIIDEEPPRFTSPEPYDDLMLLREMALDTYQWGKTNELEEDRLELLRRLIQQIDDLNARAAEAAQAAQVAAGQAQTATAAAQNMAPGPGGVAIQNAMAPGGVAAPTGGLPQGNGAAAAGPVGVA
jgi:hypothetical protein